MTMCGRGHRFCNVTRSQALGVEIEFDRYQARWLRERLHSAPPSIARDYTTAACASAESVTALDGVKRFVMQYGGHARVRAPVKILDTTRLLHLRNHLE
jgi:hypothetical protein